MAATDEDPPPADTGSPLLSTATETTTATTAPDQQALSRCKDAIEQRMTDVDSPWNGATVLWNTAQVEPGDAGYSVTGTGTASFAGDNGYEMNA